MGDQQEIDDRSPHTEAYGTFSQRCLNAGAASIHPAVESLGRSFEFHRSAYPAPSTGHVGGFVSDCGGAFSRDQFQRDDSRQSCTKFRRVGLGLAQSWQYTHLPETSEKSRKSGRNLGERIFL
jgi:hypothetical protein